MTIKTHHFRSTKERYLSDEQILKGVIKCDHSAENAFYLKYRDKLYSYTLRLVHDSEKAKDIMQDAIIITLTRIRNNNINLQHEGHLLNSMKTTVKYVFNNQLRSSKTHVEFLEIDKIEESDNFKEKLFQAVEEALIRLDKKCRNLIKYFYLEKMSMKQIMNHFSNINSVGFARNFKYRCTKKLKMEAMLILKKWGYE